MKPFEKRPKKRKTKRWQSLYSCSPSTFCLECTPWNYWKSDGYLWQTLRDFHNFHQLVSLPQFPNPLACQWYPDNPVKRERITLRNISWNSYILWNYKLYASIGLWRGRTLDMSLLGFLSKTPENLQVAGQPSADTVWTRVWETGKRGRTVTGYSKRSTGCRNGSESGLSIILRRRSLHWFFQALMSNATPRFCAPEPPRWWRKKGAGHLICIHYSYFGSTMLINVKPQRLVRVDPYAIHKSRI